MHVVHDLVEETLGLAFLDLVGADEVAELVDAVAHVEGVEDAEEEVDVEGEAGLGVGLGEAAGLLEEQDAEAVVAGVAEGEAILGLVHAEAAGTAGAGGEEDVAVDDVLLGEALVFEVLEVLDQVADGEVGRVALAVVAELLAGLEGGDVGGGDGLAGVAEALQGAVDQLFVLPGEAAEQNGRLAALVGEEEALGGLLEVVGFFLRKAGLLHEAEALFGESGLDDGLDGGEGGPDLDQARVDRGRL